MALKTFGRRYGAVVAIAAMVSLRPVQGRRGVLRTDRARPSRRGPGGRLHLVLGGGHSDRLRHCRARRSIARCRHRRRVRRPERLRTPDHLPERGEPATAPDGELHREPAHRAHELREQPLLHQGQPDRRDHAPERRLRLVQRDRPRSSGCLGDLPDVQHPAARGQLEFVQRPRDRGDDRLQHRARPRDLQQLRYPGGCCGDPLSGLGQRRQEGDRRPGLGR